MSPLVAFLAGMLSPSPSWGELAGRVRRQAGPTSAYGAALPRQTAHAAAVGLQRSITGRTGSEDWSDQERAGAQSAGPALPELVGSDGRGGLGWPVGMFVPHLPASLIEGRGTGYGTGAYPKGWITLEQAGPTSWGASSGLAASRPNVQRATLIEPTDATPKPRAMAGAWADANKGRTRLSDLFGD